MLDLASTMPLRSCDEVEPGELCEAGGECGASDETNNCRGDNDGGRPTRWGQRDADIFRRRPCRLRLPPPPSSPPPPPPPSPMPPLPPAFPPPSPPAGGVGVAIALCVLLVLAIVLAVWMRRPKSCLRPLEGSATAPTTSRSARTVELSGVKLSAGALISACGYSRRESMTTPLASAAAPMPMDSALAEGSATPYVAATD